MPTAPAVTKQVVAGPVNLQDQSIAIQKNVTGTAVPGQELSYTLDFQISDYFNFDDVVIDDVFSDGQELVDGSVTLTVTGDPNATDNISLTLTPAQFTEVVRNRPGGTGSGTRGTGTGIYTDSLNTDGSTRLQFLVSDLIEAAGGSGILNGGDPGPLRGSITYNTRILQDFTDLHEVPGFTGDQSVDATDRLFSNAQITGTVVDFDDVSTGNSVTDNTQTGIQVPELPQPVKRVYAVNGVAIETDADRFGFSIDEEDDNKLQRVKVGDLVTYRITLDGIQSPDAEDLQIIDYLPLPVFDVADVDEDGAGPDTANGFAVTDAVELFSAQVIPTGGDVAVPTVGNFSFGPDHTLYGPSQGADGPQTLEADLTGALSGGSGGIDPSNNQFTLQFNAFNGVAGLDPTARQTFDILFTVRVEDDPFDDRLFLTNQARVVYDNTEAQEIPQDTIVRIETLQPVPVIGKRLVEARAGANNAVVRQPDVGDFVEFEVRVVNEGGNSVYDLVLSDTLPEGFLIDTANLNFSISLANGDPVTYRTGDDLAALDFGVTPGDAAASFFDNTAGIRIVDDNSNADDLRQGAIDPGRDDENGLPVFDGSNELLIRYTLRVDDAARVGGRYDNQAQILNFAGVEGGQNYAPEAGNPSVAEGGPSSDTEDQERTQLALPSLTKAVINTSLDGTGNNQFEQVTIGETIQYRVDVTLPEGQYINALLQDTLPSGFTFVSLDNITQVSGGTIANLPATVGDVTVSGSTGAIDFGLGIWITRTGWIAIWR